VGGRARSLLVEDLVVRYGDVEAVHGVSFSIGAGEVLGLLGPNGAGKTSVLRVLTTLVRPAAGRAWLLGHDVGREPALVRRLIGYVPQSLSADGSLTGRENALLFARLYAVPRVERHARVDEALAVMGIDDAADQPVRTYSGGMVRRLEVACALLHAPRVLFLDEPTVGLDPVARRTVWRHLERLRDDTGATLLVTTHSMEEAEEHCGRVVVMSAGDVRAEGTPRHLRDDLGQPGGTLEDVFVALTESDRQGRRGDLRDVRGSRRAARRLG
jgi:ABC-2 type transport system ATP-binding protein